MGVILYQQGVKQEAVRQYEHAVQLSPNSATFLKNLADYYYVESKEIRKALWLYQRILTLLPSDVETLINAGSLYVALQQPLKACTLLQKALLVEPQNQQVVEIIERIRQTTEEHRITTCGTKGTQLSSHKRTGPAFGLRHHPLRMGKLVMTLLVRDEENIADKNIEFHFSQGVDFIILKDIMKPPIIV